MSDIYFNYDKVEDTISSISDGQEDIDRNNREINELLTDLGDYWKGTLKDSFVNQVKEYIDYYSAYSKKMIESYNGIVRAKNAYSNLDITFKEKSL